MNTTDPTTLAPPAPDAPAVDPMAEPTFEECIEEWNRFYDDVKAGRVNVLSVPVGHHFAYYGGRIIDHDPDFIAVQHRAAAAIGVHWARLVVRYREEPTIW